MKIDGFQDIQFTLYVFFEAGQEAIQKAPLVQVGHPSGQALKVLEKCCDCGCLFELKQRGFTVKER